MPMAPIDLCVEADGLIANCCLKYAQFCPLTMSSSCSVVCGMLDFQWQPCG